MKKLFTLLCTLLLIFTLTGCSKPANPRVVFKEFVRTIRHLFDKGEKEEYVEYNKIEVKIPHLSIDHIEDQEIGK